MNKSIPFTGVTTWAEFGLSTQPKHFLTNTTVRYKGTHLSPRIHIAVTKDTGLSSWARTLSGGPLVPRGPKAADERVEDKEGCRKRVKKNCVWERSLNGGSSSLQPAPFVVFFYSSGTALCLAAALQSDMWRIKDNLFAGWAFEFFHSVSLTLLSD